MDYTTAELFYKLTKYSEGIKEILEELEEQGIVVHYECAKPPHKFTTTGAYECIAHVIGKDGLIYDVAKEMSLPVVSCDRGHSPEGGYHYGYEHSIMLNGVNFYALTFEEANNGDKN